MSPNRQKSVIVALLCLGSTFSLSQEKGGTFYADSLLQLAQAAPNDSLRIRYLLELSNFWSDHDTTQAFAYLRQAAQRMPKANGYYQGLLHFYTAGIYFGQDIERAKREYQLAERQLKRYSHPEAYRFRARTWNNYGIQLQMQDQEKTYAAILLTKSIPLAIKARDTLLLADYHHNLALVLMNTTDYAKADQYYRLALQQLTNYPNAHEQKLTAYVNAAKNAVYGRRFPAARKYLDSAQREMTIIPHSLYAPAYYRTEGNYYRHQKQFRQALLLLDQGLKAARTYEDSFYISDILFEKYGVFRDMGDYGQARVVLLEAFAYFSKAANTHNRRLLLKELAQLDAKLGNYRLAFQWLDQYTTLSDSVFEANAQLAILELEKKYQTVEKENEILKLRNQTHHQLAKIERNRWSIAALALGLVLTLLLLYLGWKLIRKNKETARQREQLHQRELKTLRQQEQIRLFNAMIQGQEKERSRIARDLHDGLGGLLAGVKLRLSSIATKESEKAKTPDMELYKVITQLDQSVDELRRIARNMMPESLLYMGLEPALRDLCRSLSSSRTAVQFQAFDLRNAYEQALLIAVYRIVQELLTNALKHAQARHILVQCSENGDHLYITVEDDGVGFDPEAAQASQNGIGLSNIRNRVSILNGTLEIDSQVGRGSTFHIDIPLYGN
ncbi:hypothetical protein GCM10027275_46740 [Rhabdobacter roseus]|uniref:Oxygen sensor histidine kinase NreB n=1 Tax=Rhabdobacter roseus TaxID=1655419 RepID=A0A840U2V1_9BACT|nr:sensor histidine kinase [Rhabdobacter roseus]MBB5286450.1 signal transduction histidine kinase [Rhabdobacter roseus]